MINRIFAPLPRYLLLIFALFSILWFIQLDYRKLVKPDEGRYGEIAREMAATGDWVTPRLNDLKYFEKPPLQYWATAAAFRLFGVDEWTTRLWTALTGFAGILLAAFTATRIYGRETGITTAVVLGGSCYYFALGHISTLDMGVTCFLTAALAGFLLAHRDGTPALRTRNWMFFTWAAMAGAVLSKGLIGLVLPGATLMLYMLLTRQWWLLGRMQWSMGLLLFLLLTTPWFVLVSQRNDEFLHFFFIHEHFDRFAADGHRRSAPWWYFGPILAIGISPWLGWLAQSWLAGLRRVTGEEFRPALLLSIWAIFVLFFFSVSQSKLPAYILPVFPALAILIARRLVQTNQHQLAIHFRALTALACGVLLCVLVLPEVRHLGSDNTPHEMIAAYANWIRAAGAIGVAGFALAWWFARHDRLMAIVAASGTSAVAVTLAICGHNELARSNSAYYLAQAIKPILQPGMPFYSIKMYDQTLPFYLQRPLTLVAYTDELELGIKAEPSKSIATLAQFRQQWIAGRAALALIRREDFDDFVKQDFIRMRVVARDSRRVVVAKP